MARALVVVVAVVVALARASHGFRVHIPSVDPLKHSLPRRYTCEGEDVSPPLQWEGVDNRTRSFVVVVSDLNSAPLRGFVLWTLADIPATVRFLPENVTISPLDTIKQGSNSHAYPHYTGPCNPASQHTLQFTVYQMATASLGLPPAFSKEQLFSSMRGKVVGRSADVRVVFAGMKTSGGPCAHAQQAHAAPPPAPLPALAPTVAASGAVAGEASLDKAVRPDPALVSAVNNDDTQVGGGMSIVNPNDAPSGAQTRLFSRRHASH